MSWVENLGSYHVLCSPISEDKTFEAIEKARNNYSFVEKARKESAKLPPYNTLEAQEKDPRSLEQARSDVKTFLIFILIILLAWPAVTNLLEQFRAIPSQLTETSTAQTILADQVVTTLDEYPRIDIRRDYSVFVYIDRNKYMHIPYPDREEKIDSIANAWCKNGEIAVFLLPEVQIRDIRTGDNLATKSCVYRSFYNWRSQ